MSEAIRRSPEFNDVISLLLIACRQSGAVRVKSEDLQELIRAYRAQPEIALRAYHGGHTHALYEVAKDLERAKWSTHKAAGWAAQIAAELRERARRQENNTKEHEQ